MVKKSFYAFKYVKSVSISSKNVIGIGNKGSFEFGKKLNNELNRYCEKINKMSGTTHFYIPAEGHSNDDIFQSNDDLHTQINNKPHYTEYFPKMDFKKGKLDLKESAIEENIVKPLQPIGNFVNKIRGKSGHYSINNDF